MSNKYLMNISTPALRGYLKLANIYKGNSSEKKTHLVEIIVYGCITNKLDKSKLEDISIKETNKILKENRIILNSLPGYESAELKKKDMKPCNNDADELSIKMER